MLSGVYFARYWASLLFSDSAVFYVPAKILFSFEYTLGCFGLALILHRHYRAPAAAVLFFGISLPLPEALVASNQIKMDTFLLLFLTLTAYFGCFAPRSGRNLFLSVGFCAGAAASKIPAAVFFPVCVFLFMPYAVLDFEAYRPVLDKVLARASGEVEHLGKMHRSGLWEKWRHPGATLAANAGPLRAKRHVRSFSGRGPRLDIYQFTQDWPPA